MIVVNNLYTGYVRASPLLKDFSYQFDNKVYGILGESGHSLSPLSWPTVPLSVFLALLTRLSQTFGFSEMR